MENVFENPGFFVMFCQGFGDSFLYQEGDSLRLSNIYPPQRGILRNKKIVATVDQQILKYILEEVKHCFIEEPDMIIIISKDNHLFTLACCNAKTQAKNEIKKIISDACQLTYA